MTRGRAMPTMQVDRAGRGSLVNSAICVRPPDLVFDRWATSSISSAPTARISIRTTMRSRSFSGIGPTPDEVQGPRNLLFRDGCNALGYSSEPISRNVRGCRGSGECFTGCRSRAKQSMDVSYVPGGDAPGARVHFGAGAAIRQWGRRVTGVEGQVVAPFTGRVRVARFRVGREAVVLAAGCMATPVLLQQSDDLANASGQVGENLQFHPGGDRGRLPRPGRSAVRCDPGLSIPGLPATRASSSRRSGHRRSPSCACRASGTNCSGHFGEIPNSVRLRRDRQHAPLAGNREGALSRPRSGDALEWRLHPDDAVILRRALQVIAQIFFAAGAEKILPGVSGLPDVISNGRGSSDPAIPSEARLRPSDGRSITSSARRACTETRGAAWWTRTAAVTTSIISTSRIPASSRSARRSIRCSRSWRSRTARQALEPARL